MPAVVGFLGVALAAAGTAVSVVQARSQAKAQEKAAKFNEQIALDNAAVAARKADDEARQVRRRNVLTLGKQRSAAAKSGVLISGSVSEVITDSAIQGEMDRLAVLYSGALAGRSFRSEASLFGAKASNAKAGAAYETAGTALSGLGRTVSAASDLPAFKPRLTSPNQVD